MKRRKIKVGIGFATGRKSFRKVLRSYIHNWKESGLVDNEGMTLHVFVAYDLSYNRTVRTDYVNIDPELADNVDELVFIGNGDVRTESEQLVKDGILNETQAKLIFGKGYAAQRNAVIYSAIKHGMDYLIFLDDDEYPVVVTNTRQHSVWGGQHVLNYHIKSLAKADITHGYHCGYISPIPYIDYNQSMTEQDFKVFIDAISNDILSWERVKTIMQNGGVTYGDTAVLVGAEVKEVQEVNHTKFISGANLGINLTDPERVFSFYNPPGARGEDTFLSTCLSERRVLKVPCYTFHDGFSTYQHLLEGVLPIKLKFIRADNEKIVERFYRACIGWVRYKPLLLYITNNSAYETRIQQMRQSLDEVLPKVCAYFGQQRFMNVLNELEKYHKNVQNHYVEFRETQCAWAQLMQSFAKEQLTRCDSAAG